MPPSVPLNHYLVLLKPTKQNRGPIPLFHAGVFRRSACVEHSNFFKVNPLVSHQHPVKGIGAKPATKRRVPVHDRKIGPDPARADPTTSFLTAAA